MNAHKPGIIHLQRLIADPATIDEAVELLRKDHPEITTPEHARDWAKRLHERLDGVLDRANQRFAEQAVQAEAKWMKGAWKKLKLPGTAPEPEAFYAWIAVEWKSQMVSAIAEAVPDARLEIQQAVGPHGSETRISVSYPNPDHNPDGPKNEFNNTARMARLTPYLYELDGRKNDPEHQLNRVVGEALKAFAKRPRIGDYRKVDVLTTKRNSMMLAKQPALARLAQAPVIRGEIRTVAVDGEPYASPSPVKVNRWKARPTIGQLDAFPATLDGNAVGDIVLETLADYPHHIDGRSPIKADLLALSERIFPLVHPIQAAAHYLLALFGWKPTPTNVDRLGRVLGFARWLNFKTPNGLPRWMFDIRDIDGDRKHELSTVYHIGAGAWWANGSALGELNAWRLSSGLVRPQPTPIDGRGRPREWAMADRVVAGIESVLQWGPSSGKGRQGRIPYNMKPVRPGGPGPEVFIPAWHILRLAGEPATEAEYRANSTMRSRFSRLATTLDELKYSSHDGRPAEAGGTVEVVRRLRGGRHHQAGLMVRASARFVEAFRKRGDSGAWDSIPIHRLMTDRTGQ